MEIGSNGDPASKFSAFSAFSAAVTSTPGLDVAARRLCFVDITASTSVKQVFTQYKAMVQQIQAHHPNVPLVHVTVPLTVDDPGSNLARQRLPDSET